MGIPLLSGRHVTEQDVTNNSRLVMINEAMAKRFWPGEDPVGSRISTAVSSGQQIPWQTIVGVVGNVRHLGLDIEPRPEIYYHTNTQPPFGPVVVVRTTSDPKRLISIARAKVRELDRNVPISNVNTMEQLVQQSVAQRRFGMFLLGIFALLALVLAAIGIYGVLAFVIGISRREIAIRLALGATRGRVVRLIVRQGMTLVAFGITVGLVVAYYATAVLSTQLFGVTATDPLTFAAVPLVLAGIALAASYLPSRAASRIDPQQALKSD